MASAAPQLPLGRSIYDNGPAVYNYAYTVADDIEGTHFGKNEIRDGPHTEGEYHVALPDGRIQTVTYHVDGLSGYIADVNYSGQSNIDIGVNRVHPVVHSPIAHAGLAHPVASSIAHANNVALHNNIAHNNIAHNTIAHNNLARSAAIARGQVPLFGWV